MRRRRMGNAGRDTGKMLEGFCGGYWEDVGEILGRGWGNAEENWGRIGRYWVGR